MHPVKMTSTFIFCCIHGLNEPMDICFETCFWHLSCQIQSILKWNSQNTYAGVPENLKSFWYCFNEGYRNFCTCKKEKTTHERISSHEFTKPIKAEEIIYSD